MGREPRRKTCGIRRPGESGDGRGSIIAKGCRPPGLRPATKCHMRKQTVFKRAMKLMGNHFELSVVANSEGWALARIEAGVKEIQRIERLHPPSSHRHTTKHTN